ncbi:VOC family protein [Planosporangium mesophilum]|uniref:Putative glyoxalase/bleomycin resistance protein n=1 Tax=Planosporangium mesophilum TaxID=689768 RepID=A0A8J3THJ2_9ACTN|nr:VOC family protein [Planosporangium mesophilum]NJC82081.1 VOC family protein [Planosporangium mesophilum]GII26379.1 putative glyoxalase/bleomycin resistance protein [Planosporangium mesophilum]
MSTPDAEASREFYGDLFGWTWAGGSVDGYLNFYLGDRAVAGLRTADPGSPSAWMPYVTTEDADATVARVRENGGSVLSGPSELSDAARIAVVADPAGAALGVWQRLRFAGAQVANEFGTVCWSELATGTPDDAMTFYGRVFGWSHRPAEAADGTPYTEWYRADRTVAGLIDIESWFATRVPAHWTVTMLVEDCARTAARALELGGKVQLTPIDIGVGTYAQLIDPQGAGFRILELDPELAQAL